MLKPEPRGFISKILYYARSTASGPVHVFADYGAAPRQNLVYSSRCGSLLEGSSASTSYFFAKLCPECFGSMEDQESKTPRFAAEESKP